MTNAGERAVLFVPARDFRGAKSRLSALAPADRAALARRCFDRSVGAALEAGVYEVRVVTSSAEVADRARYLGAQAVRDPSGRSVEALAPGNPFRAMLRGLVAAERARAPMSPRRCGVLMADLPLVDGPTLRRASELLAERDAVIVPDRHLAGTNLLLLRVAEEAHVCFGAADSYAQHLSSLRASNLRVRTWRTLPIELDVDTADDLRLVGAAV